MNFGSQGLTQLTIRYDNHPSAQSNPALQAIAIGNLSFSQQRVELDASQQAKLSLRPRGGFVMVLE